MSRAVVTNEVGLLRGHYECVAEETFILGFFSPNDVRMRGVATVSDALFIGIAPAVAVEGVSPPLPSDGISLWADGTTSERTFAPAPTFSCDETMA